MKTRTTSESKNLQDMVCTICAPVSLLVFYAAHFFAQLNLTQVQTGAL
jgi:hypothetical protein